MRKFILAILLSSLCSTVFATSQYTFSIAVVTDWQTVQSLGGPDATKQAIQQRITDASQIYLEQFGIQLNPTMWIIPTSEAQDFPSQDTQPYFLLSAVEQYRENSNQQMAQGLTILFTTRVFTNNLVGLTTQDSAGYAQAASIVEINFGEQADAWDTAHEILHSLGANHDGDSTGSCPNENPTEYLMRATNVYLSTGVFSPCSISVVQNKLQEHIDAGALILVQQQTTPPANSTNSPAPTSHGGGGSIDWIIIDCLAVVLAFVICVRLGIPYSTIFGVMILALMVLGVGLSIYYMIHDYNVYYVPLK